MKFEKLLLVSVCDDEGEGKIGVESVWKHEQRATDPKEMALVLTAMFDFFVNCYDDSQQVEAEESILTLFSHMCDHRHGHIEQVPKKDIDRI